MSELEELEAKIEARKKVFEDLGNNALAKNLPASACIAFAVTLELQYLLSELRKIIKE